MQRRAAIVVTALALAMSFAGCSGNSDGAAMDQATTTVNFDVTTTLPAAEQAVIDECATKIGDAAPAMAAAAFPEYPDVQWSMVEVVTEGGLSFVEMAPTPTGDLRTGYRLVVECHAASEPVLYGIYELDGDTWKLLSTTDELGGAELPETLG